ncbi:DUF5986 family protein [Lactococcus lactis]|uniref:DUF5986 family protein n=1 Tax=Lactococcus lactis TaxID=1358 RepID=A0ABD5GP38_9LACT|nr:DUF5986 family protein [Lactococcus lactis]MDV2618973.1 DUF5986 family protein [Lactococcus lactis]
MKKVYCSEPEENLISLKELFEKPVSNDVKAIFDQMATRTENGRHFLAWNLRFENIAYGAENMGLVAVTIQRGNLWELVAVFNEQTKNIFLFMNNKTPESQIYSSSHYLPHTVRVLNSNFNSAPNSEVALFEDDESVFENEIKHSQEVCKSMYGEFYENLGNVFVIRRDTKTGSVTLVTINAHLDFIDEEIIPDRILPSPVTASKTTGAVSEEPIEIKLKEKKKKIS